MADSELLNIFRDEVGEYLETLNNTLLQVETSTADIETLRELNRVAHSMKGAARAVGLRDIEGIAHHMEDVFDSAINAGLGLTPEICDLVYDGLDMIQNIVDGGEPDAETLAAVRDRLSAVASSQPPADSAPPAQSNAAALIEREVLEQPAVNGVESGDEPPPAKPAPDETQILSNVVTTAEQPLVKPGDEIIRVPVSKLDRLMGEASELLVARMQNEERQHTIQDLRRMNRKWLREWQSIRAAYIRLARRMQDQGLTDDMATIFKFLETNQRYLQEANRQIAQLVQVVGQDNLRLTMLSDQLQDEISGMRLVSFEPLLGIFQRVVRDISRDLNKQIHLDVIGATVEVDKTVLEALKDPIIHLLRNAVDHGIEMPEDREALGKPAAGRIILAVEQRGNEIIVRVGDDGRGIDPDRVRGVAVRSGLLSEREADLLSDDDARSLIFHPGLTTSNQLTAISGRGIGMDIVRDRVEGLRGRISVQSTLGQGTTTSLIVPVSLTRIRCVLLHVGQEQYAIPSAVIARMVKLSRSSVFTAENRDMIVIEGHSVPLVSLADVLGIPVSGQADEDALLTVLVLNAADRTVAFEVDELYSEREVVLKQLGREIAQAQFVSGAALLGTGVVLIVLDANDLVRSATGTTLSRHRVEVTLPAADVEHRLRVLVVDDSITTRTLEKNILETAGFDVTVAIDGVEGWQLVNEAYFDVVVSDVEMPNMNGLELVHTIKSNDHTRHIPVILLTSLAKPEQREAGLKAGADAYLVKSSFDQDELMHTIRAVL